MLPVKRFETWNKHAFLSSHTQKGEVDSSSAMHTTECDGADLQCSSPDRWHQAFALTLNEQRWIFLPIIVSVGRQTYMHFRKWHIC